MGGRPLSAGETNGSTLDGAKAVGVWYLESATPTGLHWFECDGCGGRFGVDYLQLPLHDLDPCEGCGGAATHLLGIIAPNGQVRLAAPAEAEALLAA